MDPIRLNDMLVRVVAWHNRHPLARRIGAAQVHSVGEVVIPYRVRAARGPVADDASLLPHARFVGLFDALRRLRPGPPLRAAFSAAFIESLSPRAVAAWVRRHGNPTPIAPEDWPRRVVATDALLAARLEARGLTVAIDLHVLTAAIAVDGRRLRLLLDERGVIAGHRAYSRPRLLGLAAVLAAASGAVALGSGLVALPAIDLDGLAQRTYAAFAPAAPASGAVQALPEEEPAPPAPAPVVLAERSEPEPSRSESPAAVEPPRPESPAPVEPDPVPAISRAAQVRADDPPAEASAPPPAPEPPVERPAPAPREEVASAPRPDAAAGRHVGPGSRALGPLANIRPVLSDEEQRVARETGRRVRTGLAPDAVPAASEESAAAAAPRRGPVYALVAPPTRQRSQALAMLARGDLLRAMHAAPPRRDVIEAKGMWRAAFWPFETLADAERARVVFAAKGLKAEVVEF